MTTKMAVLVCDTPEKAVQATQFLTLNGYAPGQISQETVATFTYDASTYDGGTSDGLANKIVVIARK